MTDHGSAVQATLDAWRARQADRMDPLRFLLIEALLRRAGHHHGEARQRLAHRLQTLLDAYAHDLARRDAAVVGTVSEVRSRRGALGALADGIPERDSGTGVSSTPYPELALLDEFRHRWTRLRGASQLRQSLQQAPTNAGPLNSSALVHRSIALMRELSPGYLQYFLSYIDNLSSLDQLGGESFVPRETAPAAPPRKRSKSRARTPRE
ncbi:DUF2894 domain-containing protein [Dyella sp. C9]|uniref:DUF2894 domain-containing protein n=1 Tax=Dyella sp. C9 TaxID=2202154 RepID=UPI000DEEDDED|nr:DUF2894 domain-containing protein [Dyella sp. C9]